MSISKFIQRNLSSFSRARQKKQVLNTVLASDQKNEGVINLHRIDKGNVGDYYCAPHLYFDKLKDTQLDIFDFKSSDKKLSDNWIDKVSHNALIIGGGGLLNRGSFEMQMKLFEALSAKAKKTVLWGVGHNEKKSSSFGKVNNYNIDTDKFGLVGVRDFSMNESWVPCVSCMHPIFDKSFEEQQELGIIFHKKTIKNKQLLKELSAFPSTSNTTNIEDMISFIGSSQTVVTDSYHAMYWSILLGKKVVAVPNSSKFFDFKYKPVISSFENFQNDLSKTQSYSGVLEECREVNVKFADRVFDYLNI
ncbi:MAG: polysaccharide pyruvyl transferase family protein [Bacteroidia bacterium]|nr:polysaccharide pyruvyl transferase family protein [Bacteroidia bacterium]NND26543.1 hypothetical protein [Flavobacteriaceae bacterium]MBT8278353.1 polysaccharide pyruvyl transferase family protein [Bacteroidia bacterium]NNK60100.1 hypothetical protein [Flavobacteriaceae bacterium]NNL32153.1 hypothetical protein [Flavobacteriaceae bacterium]